MILFRLCTVSDDLFFATTSKRFAEGLSSLAAKGGGESRQGVWLDVDMKVLHSYAEQWLKLIEENAAEFMSDVELEDFNANKEMIETTLSALGMMDSLTYHMRQEDGVNTHVHAFERRGNNFYFVFNALMSLFVKGHALPIQF